MKNTLLLVKTASLARLRNSVLSHLRKRRERWVWCWNEPGVVTAASPGSRNAITPRRTASVSFSADSLYTASILRLALSMGWHSLMHDHLPFLHRDNDAWEGMQLFSLRVQRDVLLHDSRSASLKIPQRPQNKGIFQLGTEVLATRGIPLMPS